MSITVAFSDLNTWLSNAAANTADTAYSLNVTGLTESNIKFSDTTGTIGYVLKSNSTKYVNLSDTVIPSSVIYMYYTFFGCTSLVTAPAIPSSVTDMTSAFYGCTSLTSVYKMKAYPAITGKNCFTNDSSVRIFVPEDNYYEWISNAATWGLTASQIYKDTFIHFDKNSVTSNSVIYFVEKLSCASAPLSMKITDICFNSDILSAVTVDKMLYKISGNNIFVCVKATIGTIKDTTKNPYVLFIHEVYDASGNKIDFTQGGYYVYTYSASTEKYIESFYDRITAPIVKFTTGEKYDYTL